jgi:carbonic anhydrase
VRHILVVGHARAGAGEVLTMGLADGSERVLPVSEILQHPERVFGGLRHA